MSQVTVFDRTGNVLGTAGLPGDADTISVSPKDDSRLLVLGDAGNLSFMTEVGQAGRTELDGDISWMDWTVDGERLVGMRDKEVFTRPVDGGTESFLGRLSSQVSGYQALSPDRRNLLVRCSANGPTCWSSLSDAGVFSEPVPIVATKEWQLDASFSPDGLLFCMTRPVAEFMCSRSPDRDVANRSRRLGSIPFGDATARKSCTWPMTMPEQGGNHKVMNASFEQMSRKCVTAARFFSTRSPRCLPLRKQSFCE